MVAEANLRKQYYEKYRSALAEMDGHRSIVFSLRFMNIILADSSKKRNKEQLFLKKLSVWFFTFADTGDIICSGYRKERNSLEDSMNFHRLLLSMDSKVQM